METIMTDTIITVQGRFTSFSPPESPSFNWKKNLDDATIAKFQRELGAMGYKYQFITLAGIHSMWFNMFDLAQDYVKRGMSAYVEKVPRRLIRPSRRQCAALQKRLCHRVNPSGGVASGV